MTTVGILKTILHANTSNCSLRIDATRFPVLVATWTGTLSNDMMDRYFDLRAPLTKYADDVGAKIVVITEISELKIPSSVERKYVAQRASEVDPNCPCLLGYVVVAPSALLRGAVTAVRWFMGDSATAVRTADSLQSAFAVTRQMYQQAGLVAPSLAGEDSPK